MSEFWIYLQAGLKYVLDFKSTNLILFLLALTAPYIFKDWKKITALLAAFTLGHMLALILAAYHIVMIKAALVGLLVPATILFTAAYGLFTAGKAGKANGAPATVFIAIFIGFVHGLGFANYFNAVVWKSTTGKLIPLLEFELGITLAQIAVVFILLILAYAVQTFFRFSKRDWALVVSAFVIGVVVPMLAKNQIWTS